MTGATRVTGEASSASPSAPIEDFLIELHKCVSGVNAGKVADYIPELGKVDPAIFGITLATVDGEIYETGDDEHRFTIQSVSKPFMYGYALQHYGRDYVLRHVGVEPTGEAFNSIVLDEVANRPFNPMVNTGAIAVAALMPGNTAEERIATMLDLFSNLAGRRLEIDQSVFQSEQATGHRNRAIAYMMLNTGMIERDPIELLAEVASQDAEPKFALSKLDVFNGLSSDECHLLETIVRPLMFNKGEVIIREGDQAKLFFVLARGTVRRLPLGRRRRRREGHLLRACGRGAQGTHRRAPQYYGDDFVQSDARLLRAPVPRQPGNPLAGVTRSTRPTHAATSAPCHAPARAARSAPHKAPSP